jgi:hypothetical protein
MTDLTKLKHSSIHNYQQIYLRGSTSTVGTQTVIHGLTYIPYIRIWVMLVSGEISAPVIVSASTVYHSRYSALNQVDTVKVTTTDLKATLTGTVTFYYRIYKDKASA